MYILSNHAKERILERGIQEKWIEDALSAPQLTDIDSRDSSIHIVWKKISEFGNRVLRVCYNPNTDPIIIVTVFFDRSMRGKL